jgi:hypothetical protein
LEKFFTKFVNSDFLCHVRRLESIFLNPYLQILILDSQTRTPEAAVHSQMAARHSQANTRAAAHIRVADSRAARHSQADTRAAAHIPVADSPAEELRFQDRHRKEPMTVGTADTRAHIRWAEGRRRAGR